MLCNAGMVVILTAILAAYLVGAVPFGLLVGRQFGIADIRQVGSGNIGATNVLRSLGMKAAIWVYLLDIGKGVLTVWAASLLGQTVMRTDLFLVVIGLATIMGHVFPVYLGFRGGKGVATTFGVLLVLLPLVTLLAGAVFLAVVLTTRYVSLASIAAGLTFPVTVTVERLLLHQSVSPVYWALTGIIGLFVPLTHRANIRRLLAGTEHRFTFSGSRENAHG
ncbi:MAG: glycerol-3-phosphate 1-O-acyltransferase PlsY [Candidatus Zixiibacteriota bacterium]